MRSPLLLGVLVMLACNRQPAPRPAPPPPTAPTPSQPGQATGATVAGTVLERLDAPPYTYLRLDALGGQQWAAVPKSDAKPGDAVVVTNAMPMDGFESKTLGRKFDRIVFGTLVGTPAPPSPAGEQPVPPQPPPGHPPVGKTAQAAVAPGTAAVPRATGANAATVAELYAKKASLAGKTVRVRARVVKVLPGIMGKTWIHVRDGSGSEERKDNDLTVTTDADAAMGAVVLVEGVLKTDRDLGSGYFFPVIIENARVTTP
jgi:hypothetical protein